MIKLAKNLEMPIAAVTQKFAFLGRSSSGKTYGSTKLAEEMLKVGVDSPQTQRLEPRDVTELTSSIKKLTVEMEANTPAALRKRIAELERDLSAAQKSIPRQVAEAAVITKTTEVLVPVLDQEGLAQIEAAVAQFHEEMRDRSEAFLGHLDEFKSAFMPPRTGPIYDALMALRTAEPKIPLNAKGTSSTSGAEYPAPTTKPNIFKTTMPPTSSPIDNGIRAALNPKQRKMIDTLLTFERLGRDSVERAIVGAFSGMSSKSGSFNTYVSGLKNGKEDEFPSLIGYVSGSRLCLTESGRTAAQSTIEINSVSDLHNAWKDQIKVAKQREMLDLVIAHHPNPVSRDYIGEQVEMSSKSGSFNTYISGIKKLGIIEYTSMSDPNNPGKTTSAIKATDLLFPEGLR